MRSRFLMAAIMAAIITIGFSDIKTHITKQDITISATLADSVPPLATASPAAAIGATADHFYMMTFANSAPTTAPPANGNMKMMARTTHQMLYPNLTGAARASTMGVMGVPLTHRDAAPAESHDPRPRFA